MSLDTIMNLSITVDSRAPTEEGFGTPLLFGYHTAWLDRLTQEYANADEMLDDGFTADDDLYKASRIVKSQDPSPQTFKIGRRVTPLTQKIAITPTKTTEGFKYKGLIGGKTLSYTVLAGATTTTIATALVSAINALVTGATAANDSPATMTSSLAGPWELTSGHTLVISVDADVPGSPDTATFTGVAAARECVNAETYNFAGGKILTVKIDGGSVQTITFIDGNFAVPAAATAEEVVAVISSQIVGASASATTSGTKVTITSDKKGTGSHVEVTGGTANAVLAFNTAVVNGTGNVASIAAVTFAEAQTVIEAATDAVCSLAVGGYLTLSSPTTGTSSKLLVASSSTADTDFGLDNATHTGASSGDTVTCTSDDPGVVVSYDLGSGMQMADVTEDTSTDNELPDIADEDSNWYGLLVVDSQSPQTVLNQAAWIESQRKISCAQTCDTNTLDGNDDTDVMTALKDSSYARTHAVYHRAVGGVEWLAAGWMGGYLTTTPGKATAAFKEVHGVKVDSLLQAQENSILAKNGSHYTNTGGLNITFEGKSGSGAFIDTTRFIDFIYARMRERVLSVLANNPKIPFTDSGVDTMRSAILAVIQLGITNGGFAATPEPTVTAPLVKDVSLSNRANRILPDINWTATLAGAIHRLNPVTGRVSV